MQTIIDLSMRRSHYMVFGQIRHSCCSLPECLSCAAVSRLLTTAACAFVVSAALSVHASGLTKKQAEQAHVISNATQWPRARTVATAEHPLGRQTLSVEKQERKGQQGTRWANVYQYHYDLQSARLLLIDLETGMVTKQSPINTVHLPLNTNEIDFAISLLGDDTVLIDQLRLEQKKRHQVAFASLDELDVKASIFEPMDASHKCNHQRCALVSLFDQTGTVFNLEPIVNLTQLTVQTLDTQ